MAEKVEKQENKVKFTKKQILEAKKYQIRKDLLMVLLSEEKQYSFDEVDKVIQGFMKKEVK